VAGVQFLCPACKQGLRLRRSYFAVAHVMGLMIAGLLAYVLGARDDVLFWAVCFGGLPAAFIVVNISMRVFPPDVEVTGEFRGILYGDGTDTAARDDTGATGGDQDDHD
jgi:hypothetical protein